MKPELNNKKANLAKMIDFIDKIMNSRKDTHLIVFPELITTGYECTKEQFQELAEAVPSGEAIRKITELCKRYGVYLVYGFAERDPVLSDVLYNSAVLINDKGDVAGVYRKTHLFDTEKQWCRPGCELPVFETSFGKIGIMICWDTAFPEVARTFALKGADLLIVPTNWEKPFSDDWDLITKARAFDNTLHLVAANRIGDDKKLGFFGHSKIIDPVGKEIASLDEEVEGVIYASLDLNLTVKKRVEYYTFFKDRNPEIYREIVRKY
jgi:predicted amidohydrolase